jgi:hypothetical protein
MGSASETTVASFQVRTCRRTLHDYLEKEFCISFKPFLKILTCSDTNLLWFLTRKAGHMQLWFTTLIRHCTIQMLLIGLIPCHWMLLLKTPLFPHFVIKKIIQISSSIDYIFEKLLKHVLWPHGNSNTLQVVYWSMPNHHTAIKILKGGWMRNQRTFWIDISFLVVHPLFSFHTNYLRLTWLRLQNRHHSTFWHHTFCAPSWNNFANKFTILSHVHW